VDTRRINVCNDQFMKHTYVNKVAFGFWAIYFSSILRKVGAKPKNAEAAD